MSEDDKVENLNNKDNNQKQKGSPVEQAVNKLREAKVKEAQSKVDSQAKVAFDAKVVSDKEMEKLKEAIEALEFEKARINQFAKDAKDAK